MFESTFEIFDQKTFFLEKEQGELIDVVRQAIPVVQLDLEKLFMSSPIKAIIDLGVTHSFISKDSMYLDRMLRYGTLIDDPDMPTFEQIVLWRNWKVRI